MRHGYKIYDSDTHINPSAEDLQKYMDTDFLSRLPDLEGFKSPNGPAVDGEPQRHVYQFGQLRYRRILGEADNNPVLARQRINASGALRGGGGNQKAAVQLRVGPNGIKDGDPKDRVMDMDYEGCDVQFMFAGGWPGVGAKDPTLQAGLMRAFHRWMDDYCADYPDRLKAGIVVSADNIEVSVEEIKKWGNTKWAAAILPWVGREQPLDHPDLEPIWAAAADHDLAVASHGNTWQYPYFPGYEDVWQNVLLARAASHPWTAQRFIGSFIGAGIMDRYPNIRMGVIEAGSSWLPFWSARITEQEEYVGGAQPLEHPCGEYMANGRFFCSIEQWEGERLTKFTSDVLGDGVLMYASDYPHMECAFPDHADIILPWAETFGEEAMRKLMFDNANRFYKQT